MDLNDEGEGVIDRGILGRTDGVTGGGEEALVSGMAFAPEA